MYNQKVVRLLIAVAGVLAASLLIAFGYGIATVQHKAIQQEKASIAKKQQGFLPSKEIVLTKETVKEFLVAYYTRKDLEENRDRYKPFMTDAMYTSAVNDEESAVQQAYKGYMVDQVFENALIYIDTDNRTAIAQITYTNVLLSEKDNRDGLSTEQTTTVSLRLNYLEENGVLLVNQLTPIAITDSKDLGRNRYRPSSSSHATESSSGSSETISSSSENSKSEKDSDTSETTNNKEE